MTALPRNGRADSGPIGRIAKGPHPARGEGIDNREDTSVSVLETTGDQSPNGDIRPVRPDGGGDVTALVEKLLLTIPETAEVLRVHKATVYRLFDRGELRWVNVGSRRLVTRAEVDRFVSQHERGAA